MDSIGGLEHRQCDRARMRRDRHFDGRFFTGVRTTRIYCRPVCPVHPAQSKNVTFYPTAAWLQKLPATGPCLRCRPDTAPFSPAWQGSRATVHRAVRLIRAGALDDAGINALADRLGIGARHLDRLFRKHIGASPLQVARTTRIQKAKRLLDETKLPMVEVAARGIREPAALQRRLRPNLQALTDQYSAHPLQARLSKRKGPAFDGPFRSGRRRSTWSPGTTCRPSRRRCRRPGS